jgi:hypothetical protein
MPTAATIPAPFDLTGWSNGMDDDHYAKNTNAAEPGEKSPDQSRRIAELEAELAFVRGQLADRDAKLAALRPKRDEWHDRIAGWLAKEAGDRHASSTILSAALGIEPEHHNSSAFRRLAGIMRRSGWTPSTIAAGSSLARGWRRKRY